MKKFRKLYIIFNELNKKQRKLSLFMMVLLAVLLVSTFTVTRIVKSVNKKKAEQLEELSLYTYNIVNKKEAEVLVTFAYPNGIEKIIDFNNKEINCHGRTIVGIDYKLTENQSYTFKLEYKDKIKKDLVLDYEFPRIKGEYVLRNGIYVNKPDVSTGFNQNKTRYMYLDNSGNLVPGNWLNGQEPTNWWDYSTQNWANIYAENDGEDSYYVWIPRYCYKVDTTNTVSGNERMDIKFINTYDEYWDAEGNVTKWEELERQGYKLPEAFSWISQFDNPEEKIIPGYWMSKYQLTDSGEKESYPIDYTAIVNATTIEVENIKTSTAKTIAKYTYAIDGEIKNVSTTAKKYIFTDVLEGNKTINVTALDENGEIIGSMTKDFEVSEPTAPDTSSFNPQTTFYVYWDENGNEHNEIPISEEPPSEWYNYSTANWANIVSRNDGVETYLVWIPRYQYKLNQRNERTYIKFINSDVTTADNGYKIPEAFWWDNNTNGKVDEGEQLEGYWMTKYQLSLEEIQQKINAEMSAGNNLIRIRNITGTLITSAQTNGTNLNIEYYINGEKVHEGTNVNENYVYNNLEDNKIYGINIIIRNKDTDEYIGAITKQMKTIEPYAPVITESEEGKGFNPENTYYVIYDDNGNEKERLLIKDNPTPPSDWYDYSQQKWANIVTISNNTTTYFVWIPRYEYKITTDRDNLNKDNRRVDVTFITTDITNDNCSPGYKVPEAFWWDNNANGKVDEGEKLEGYWMSKYQLNE